jgi:bis(5'-nucleosidyl)-tetraphosphatase
MIQSAGVVIVRRTSVGPRYLLVCAYGNWDFPKGIVEPGENPVHAACREVEEETGLTGLVFSWGVSFKETEPYGPASRLKVARYYIAEIENGGAEPRVVLPVCPELGRPENDEFRWVGYREARKLLPARLLPIIHWAYQITAGKRGSRV